MGYFIEAGNSICWQEEGEILLAEPYGADVIRVRATRSLHIPSERWNIREPGVSDAIVESTENGKTLKNGGIFLSVANDGTLTFRKADGDLLVGAEKSTLL